MDDPTAAAKSHLETLCSVQPNRRTGSPGNRAAVEFIAGVLRSQAWEVAVDPFACLDHVSRGARLYASGESHAVQVSPYSMPCDVAAGLLTATTVDELAGLDCRGRLLLLHGEICAEQLMPKNFTFYNPEHHQKLIALLEKKQPAAIIAATRFSPDQVGALDPFPLIVDGDFNLPNVYCQEAVGNILAARLGEECHLVIDARRIPSTAANVVARLNPTAVVKILLTAHLDAYENSPGASDNASGCVVLLLCAQLLAGYCGSWCVEIAALNGEDHYSAGGQMDYLHRYQSSIDAIKLVINIDDVGVYKAGTVYSFYDCPERMTTEAVRVFQNNPGLQQGDPWSNGDHMIFVQQGIPAIAFTSQATPRLMRTITHTEMDTPDLIDCRKLVSLAGVIRDLVDTLPIPLTRLPARTFR